MQETEVKDQKEDQEETETQDARVYEASFLLSPSIAEEKLPEEVSALKTAIEEFGGIFISEDFPRLRPLSYEMVKKIDNKNQKYNQAYFGWVKFEIEPSKMLAIKNSFQNNLNIIRFLLIETVKENTLYSHKLAVRKDREAKSARQAEEAALGPVSEEEIDKSIEKLVVSE